MVSSCSQCSRNHMVHIWIQTLNTLLQGPQWGSGLCGLSNYAVLHCASEFYVLFTWVISSQTCYFCHADEFLLQSHWKNISFLLSILKQGKLFPHLHIKVISKQMLSMCKFGNTLKYYWGQTENWTIAALCTSEELGPTLHFNSDGVAVAQRFENFSVDNLWIESLVGNSSFLC